MWKCGICNEEFDNAKIGANHIRWKHKEIKISEKGRKKLSQSAIYRNTKKYGEKIKIIQKCKNCNIEFETFISEKKGITRKTKKCCSRKCAAIFSQSFVDTKNISKAIKNIYTNNPEHPMCNTWKLSINKKYFSSKNERFIRDYFISKYSSDEWTHGPLTRFNEINLVCDLYSKKLKVIFEYDGIWHFKDIYGQLKDKQLKDKLLERWCVENNYRLIRIKEEIFNQDKAKWLCVIENEIYNSKEQIVKYY